MESFHFPTRSHGESTLRRGQLERPPTRPTTFPRREKKFRRDPPRLCPKDKGVFLLSVIFVDAAICVTVFRLLLGCSFQK